ERKLRSCAAVGRPCRRPAPRPIAGFPWQAVPAPATRWPAAGAPATLCGTFRTPGGGMQRRQFLGSAAAAALMLSLPGGPAMAAPRPSRLLPMPLAKGDTVALVSPSAATDERLDLRLSQEVMEALGFRVKTGAHFGARRGHLAGSDEARAADINAAFADEEVRAVIAVRGGSGAARVLPLLDYEAIRANPK